MPDDFEVRFNTVELLNGLSKPFHEANESMGRDTQMEVRSDKWSWPRETERKRGGTVGSPRNIIDETAFSTSHETERMDATTHEHRFGVDYAVPVILGAVLNDGTKLPARNVFKEPLKKLPKKFGVLARAELAKIKDPL